MYNVVAKQKIENGRILVGQSTSYVFNSIFSSRYNYKLRLVGETDVPYYLRTEDVFAIFYRKLDDSLVSYCGEYVLKFNEENFCKTRVAYQMIRSVIPHKYYTFGVKAKIKEVANFRVSLEVFYGAPKSRKYREKADEIFELSLKESNEFSLFEKQIKFSKSIDFIMIKVEANEYYGEAEIFTPFLLLDGINYVKPFEKSINELKNFYWIGEGFSLTEKPKFTIKLNDRIVFCGRKIDRVDRFSGCEFVLPAEYLNYKNNKVEIIYAKENSRNYTLKEIQIISTPRKFEVLANDETVFVNKSFGVLVNLDRAVLPSFKDNSYVKYLGCKHISSGVNVLEFVPLKEGENIKLELFDGKIKRHIKIRRIICKTDDDVITGTGDAIYIAQDIADFTEFLTWYIKNSIGKLLTFRSVYRWGTTLECNYDFWNTVKRLLTDMKIYYSLMIDGRELNGLNANPPKELLDGEFFLGEQTHERDGAYTYWKQEITDQQTETFYHVLSAKIERNGIYGKLSPVYNKNGEPRIYIAEDSASDVREAYTNLLKNLKNTAIDGATRHTGVTTFFHTFLEAGYDFIGYESMYGPHELMLGAIRGMSSQFGKKEFGTHLALQWSTMPLETRGHLLRYKISLNLSYMHGATEINTEEGLWRFSNGYVEYDRFSEVCKNHLKIQRKFNEFVQTHKREGKLLTNIAMLVGNYDGMDCFSKDRLYGQKGEEWEKSSPEESWDILKLFFPKADINAIYYYVLKGGKDKIQERDKALLETLKGLYRDVVEEKSLGFYSDTPYGPIDIVTAENGNFEKYDFLFFTGWNTITENQLIKLCKYVAKGGILLLAKPHLYNAIDRNIAINKKAKLIDSKYVKILLSYRDTGRVIYFDRDEYPIAYADEYKKAIISSIKSIRDYTISNVKNISYTCYNTSNGKVYYLQNINWWNNTPASFDVNYKNKNKKISIYNHNINTLMICNNENVYYNDKEI